VRVDQVYHTIRQADGSWLPFGDVVSAVSGFPVGSGAYEVPCAAVAGELHICTAGAKLCHSLRRPDGSWTALTEVPGQPSNIVAAGCAGIGSDLHVCAISSGDWRLWHTVRRSDGSWLPFGDVETQTGATARFLAVAVANVSGELHVAALTRARGILGHAIRHSDGTWTTFGDVGSAAGYGGMFDYVALGATV
jgi:hypothetical protein